MGARGVRKNAREGQERGRRERIDIWRHILRAENDNRQLTMVLTSSFSVRASTRQAD